MTEADMFQTTASPPSETVHSADCDIWSIPSTSGVEQIFEAGYRDETVARYLSEVSPIYAVLSRILGQLSGVLLLALTAPQRGRPASLDLDHAVFTIAADQLTEAQERLRVQTVPASDAAIRHHAALSDCARHLGQVMQNMDRLPTRLGDLRDAAQRDIIRQLHVAQRLLIATAEPEARITPVDFTNACCSCGTVHIPISPKP